MKLGALAAAAFVAVAIPLVGSPADAVAAERQLLGKAVGVPLKASADPVTAQTLARVRKQAIEVGASRVIVGVRAAFAPEGSMSAVRVSEQRYEIAAMQSAVLEKIPSLGQQPERVKRFEFIPFMALVATLDEIEALAGLSEVISIEEDRLSAPHLAESVPLAGGSRAWSLGYTGAGQTIAIIDSGVDKTLPFLAGKVVSEACYSDGFFLFGTKSLCPGFWDASTDPGSAMPYPQGGDCPPGKCDHGTHVAGIAAGSGGRYSGVARDAKLIAIQVFQRLDRDSDCAPTEAAPCIRTATSDQIRALQRVYDLRQAYPGIAAVNMSLGGGRYESQSACDADNGSIKAAIQNLRSVNIATVISSGNDGYRDGISAPGCISAAISVGATWDYTDAASPRGNSCGANDLGAPEADAIACYSNSAPFLGLLAPGSLITSSVPVSGSNPTGEAPKHGTSMAAPHVAGAWALLRQKQASLTVDAARAALCATGVPILDPRNGIVKSRIQLDAALAAVGGPPTFTFAGEVVNRGNAAVAGARISFVANGRTYASTTDAAGYFSLTFDPTNVPSQVAYWVTRDGYLPLAGNLTLSTCSANVGTLTLELSNASTVILEVVPEVHHLGDSNYSGTPNSGFQKPDAEGLTFSRTFNLSAAQADASAAVLTLLAKGLQDDNRLLINGQLVGHLSVSPEDGSFTTLSIVVPMSRLLAGANTLTIESVGTEGSGYDDFEFTNVTLLLSGVVVPGAPSAPLIGTAIAADAGIAVAFTPGALGSGTLFDYTAECGGSSRRGGSSPITVRGLANGTPYACRVKATTTVGDSPWSALSNTVTPAAPDDGFPNAGSLLPPGWTHPAGSNAAWSVSSESPRGGTQSLKSGAIGHSQRSDLAYGASFPAGTVSFAIKVSSEAGYDFLEFYIDGVLAGRWSGEVAWTTVSFAVAPGFRTFLWRYVKDGSQVSGSDAAWIDGVLLPGARNYTLSVAMSGTGSGVVTSNPAGINCGAICSASYGSGASVSLAATAAAGSVFGGWSGACSGRGPCTLVLSASATATAHFYVIPDNNFPGGNRLPPGWIQPAGSDASWVVSNVTAYGGTQSLRSGTIGHGQRSDLSYSAVLPAGNVGFAIMVSSEGGYDFLEFYIDGVLQGRWSGEVPWSVVRFPVAAGMRTLLWRYRKDGSATSGLDGAWVDGVLLPGETTHVLGVARSGTGSGFVTSVPTGIVCGGECNATYRSSATITLTATPSAGSSFAGWSGACSGTGPCNVAMSTDKAVTATFAAAPSPVRLANLSTRMQVLTGNDVMIGGFVIGGPSSKTVVVRARGPSLVPFGIADALADPTLQLVRSSDQSTVAINDDWGTAENAAVVSASGFAPANALESAVLATLAPGAYTAIVSGFGGGTGVGIVEVFEVDHAEIPLVNISTRGQVRTGNDVMIGGFVIQGDAPKTVVIRARGPSLAAFGITNPLANPMLQLVRSADQATIAVNDNWAAAPNAAQIGASGFAPSNALESAILVTLGPGAYTAIVTGVGGSTGVGIVEVFAQ